MGDEGALTLTVRMRVGPEPVVVELLKRYRNALWYSIRRIHGYVEENKLRRAPSISTVHKLLYEELKSVFELPSRIDVDCYREALAIHRSWLKNRSGGRLPIPRKLRIWLTHGQGYRVKDGCVEITGGYRLRIIGWDGRYDAYENREARLVYRDGEMYLFITKSVPKPRAYTPRGVLAADVNEKTVVFGNSSFVKTAPTPVERAMHYKKLAERLQTKYSNGKYRPWLARRGIRERVRSFHRKARSIVEDWAKKTSLKIVREALNNQYAIAVENLNGLVESIRKLPKEHKVKLILLSYRRLLYWVKWQAEKHGVPVVKVDPRGTSTTCPRCGGKLRENGYRKMKCSSCGFEEDRDVVAVLNIEKVGMERFITENFTSLNRREDQIEKKALFKMGGPLTASTAPQMKDVSPNRCREPSQPQGTLAL